MTDLYKREVSKNGKVRYVPVAHYSEESISSYPYGTHLVVCRAGSTRRIYNVDVDYAPLIAAMHHCIDDMATAVYEASQAKPKKTPVTPEQKEAWENLKKAYGDELFSITYPSAHDVAKAGIEALYDVIKNRMEVPAVKAAYENFMLIFNLMADYERS